MSKIRNKPTDVAAIRAWYENDAAIELTEHQEEKRRRLLSIISLMTKGKANSVILKHLQKDHGLSLAQSYRDIRDAVVVYGDLRKAEKEGIRWIQYDLALNVYRKAMKSEDWKAANQAQRNMIKITGIDREDPELPDFEKLKPSLNIVVIDQEIEDKVKALLQAGPVDLSTLHSQKPETIDVEHEEITDTEEGSADQ